MRFGVQQQAGIEPTFFALEECNAQPMYYYLHYLCKSWCLSWLFSSQNQARPQDPIWEGEGWSKYLHESQCPFDVDTFFDSLILIFFCIMLTLPGAYSNGAHNPKTTAHLWFVGRFCSNEGNQTQKPRIGLWFSGTHTHTHNHKFPSWLTTHHKHVFKWNFYGYGLPHPQTKNHNALFEGKHDEKGVFRYAKHDFDVNFLIWSSFENEKNKNFQRWFSGSGKWPIMLPVFSWVGIYPAFWKLIGLIIFKKISKISKN